jgi:Na+/H+ antiporter NhaD/arsenite permease-like protein
MCSLMGGTRTTRATGKYMKLLTLLAMLAAPGSGTVFDETTIRVTVPVVLDASLTRGGKDVPRS